MNKISTERSGDVYRFHAHDPFDRFERSYFRKPGVLLAASQSMEDILDRLQPVFREVLEDPSLLITRESSALTVDGWDSLAHVSLIAAVEEMFSVRFALGELEELRCVGDMIDLIVKKRSR